jgi:hypothetical protein
LKNKEKPHSKTLLLISLTFVCLISISSVALAASTQLTDSKLILDLSADGLAIYGDKIVWTNYRNGIPYLTMFNLNSELQFDAPSEDDFIFHFPDKLPIVAAFSISPSLEKHL